MKLPWQPVLSVLFLLVVTAALTSFQTSLWVLALGGFPPPLFWLMMLVYVGVTRTPGPAVLIYYPMTLIISSFTVYPFEHFLLLNMLLLGAVLLVKGRIFWPGPTYFTLLCGSLSLVAPIVFWMISRVLDKNPVFLPEIFTWVVSGLMTMLVSLPIYRFLEVVEKAIQAEGRSERLGAGYE